MNPYQSPLASTQPDSISHSRNPAKPLLVVIGVIFAGSAPLAFLTGLQAGLHFMIASALMIVFGSGTIWLAFEKFTMPFKVATIIWGFVLSRSSRSAYGQHLI